MDSGEVEESMLLTADSSTHKAGTQRGGRVQLKEEAVSE